MTNPNANRTEDRLRSLERWNRFWVTLLCLVALCAWGWSWLRKAQDAVRVLHCRRTAEGLRLHSIKDGPWVVTHLSYRAGYTPENRVARLPEPVAIIDSYGARISNEELRRLKWQNHLGEPASAPPAEAPLIAWYYEPETTVEASHSRL